MIVSTDADFQAVFVALVFVHLPVALIAKFQSMPSRDPSDSLMVVMTEI